MDEGLGVQVTVEEVRQLNAQILQLIDLPVLVPLLVEKGVLTGEIVNKVNDYKHHTQFERSNFLLSFLYQQGQAAIDSFLECLRETRTTNHSEILRLLEGDLHDTQLRSPLFTILDKHVKDITRNINLVSLLKSLLSEKTISLNTFLDLQNTDRTLEETLERLLPVLEDKGSKGFISFLSCLQKDLPNPGHERLSEILFTEVNKFFKEHPDRDQISRGDKTEIQQLERRERVIGQEIHQKLTRHRDILIAQINVQAVLPALLKKQVIARQDSDYLSLLDREAQSTKLLDLLLEKELSLLIKFAECLKESPDNREAGELLLPSPASQTPADNAKKPEAVITKHEMMAVFVYADHYLSPNGNPASLEPQRFDGPIQEQRETLKRQLESMNFHVHTLDTNIDTDDFTGVPRLSGGQKMKIINTKFQDEIVNNCSDDAVVLIFLSGIQFPCKSGGREYRGAILRTNASKFGRLPLDSIECQDVVQWVGLLPNCHVTILIDTEPSHVVAFNKMQRLAQVEIMDDPWAGLTAFDSNTVVFYLKPDPDAIAKARGSSVGSPLGMLTETATRAITSCVLKNKEEVSHRSLFEAVSFYWYSGKDGPLHQLYKPMIAGDLDRCFLGKTAIPYQQVFRGDLQRANSSEVFLNQIKIPVGTMAGLIQGDQLVFFHVLRPGLQVSGHVSTAYQLHCEATVDKAVWVQLRTALRELYKDGELKDSKESVEFLLVKKKFPLRQRLTVYPRELERGASNSLKTYIKEHSNLLSFVPQEKEAKVVVSYQDQLFHVEDIDKDELGKDDIRKRIKYPMKTKSIERVKSLLEMMAWYKCVRSFKSKQKVLPSYECSLTAAVPLLSAAAPNCQDFEISWSSCQEASSASLGYEAILSFTSPLQFWVPYDRNPYLKVHFKRNCLITTIEVRGHPHCSEYVKQVSLSYNKTILEKVAPSDVNTLDVESDEPAQYVILKAEVAKSGDPFTVAIKLRAKQPGSKTKSEHLNQLRLLKQLPPSDAITPGCDQTGLIKLDPTKNIFIWSGGGGGGELTLSLGVARYVEKIEFIDRSNVSKLTVSLETINSGITTSEFTSHPKKYLFPRPIIASNVTVCPIHYQDDKPVPLRGVPLQLQLHGNIQDEPLDVDEENLMLFQFNTLADMQLYFYVLCFEETGAITLLNEGKEEAPKPHDKRFPPAKILLEACIPEGYCPEAGHILDEYHIWVSTTQLSVEPFLQRGVHEYHKPITYNVCTQGLRTREIVRDEWYDHHYSVKIKKS